MGKAMTSEGHAGPNRSWRWITGGAIIVVVILYLVLSGAQGGAVYAMTIQELKSQRPAIYGRGVRVGGIVDGDSIAWNADEMTLQFNLVDGEEALPVTHAGIQPDAFRDGAQALVEGRYRETGVFEASRLLFECPSKYEAPLSTHEP
jgi:cytochrome c-type biogenesis protein CcmE